MDNIGNKIVTLDIIIKIAQYYEEKKKEYIKLLEMDRIKNKDLSYGEERYEYKGKDPKVEYTIYFIDGKTLTETSYDWFIQMLNDKKFIKKIAIYEDFSYSSNLLENIDERIYKSINFRIVFDAEEYEDIIKIRVIADNLEEQGNRIRNELSNIISECEPRYNKTIKNKNIRIQSFCFSLGFVLSYILFLILLINIKKLPSGIVGYLNNKNVIVFGQWFLAILLGNLFGYGIIMSIYKILLPKLKYDGYSTSSHKTIYKEDVKEYIKHSEIQIGRFWNNKEKRAMIEKMFAITWKIIVVQLIISTVLYFIL